MTGNKMENICCAFFLVLFISMIIMWIPIGGVLCFNCVSTESQGCDMNLDLSLLVKSTRKQHESHTSESIRHRPHSSQHNQDSSNSTNDYEIHSSKESLTNYTTTHKNNSGNISPMSSRFNDYNNSSNNVTNSIPTTFKTQPAKTSPKESQHSKVYQVTPEFYEDGFAEIERNSHGSPTSNLMVKCPGNTCLTQRIPTTKGNIIVRTCDVSHVPSGQCHLVTNVLGAKLSVVCVCEGHFCNENPVSGTTTLIGPATGLMISVFVYVTLQWRQLASVAEIA